MTYSPAVIAAAKALAEKHGYKLPFQRNPDLSLMLCEALSTTLPSEEAMSDADSTPHSFNYGAPDTCRHCGNGKDHAVHAPKSEPTKDHLNRAWDLLGRTPAKEAADAVARLLAERDAMQARVEEPVAWLYDGPEMTARKVWQTRQSLSYLRAETETPLYAGKPAEPTPDPDLVLAREAAAKEYELSHDTQTAADIRNGRADALSQVSTALRALKLAKEQAHE